MNPSPYDILREAGVGPGSTMAELRDCSYWFMERRRWTPDVRAAWDELRTVESRLVADLLLPGGSIDPERLDDAVLDAFGGRPGTLPPIVEYDR